MTGIVICTILITITITISIVSSSAFIILRGSFSEYYRFLIMFLWWQRNTSSLQVLTISVVQKMAAHTNYISYNNNKYFITEPYNLHMNRKKNITLNTKLQIYREACL